MGSIFDFLFGSATAIWFWMAIIFVVIEIETFGLISVWFVFGAIVSMLASLFISSVLVQSIIFIAVSVVLLLALRSYAVHNFRNKTVRKNNIDELTELPCVIVADIKAFDLGEVKLQGKIWRARSESGRTYHIDEHPNVLRIEGNTIIVE
ncbi:MAG: NfeD family protein [Defluviitaleaceae bacterium]|nr:NfeD family protein [Defluviitaleaceae bacterium]